MKQVARGGHGSNRRPLNYSEPETLASSQLHLERRKRFSGIELSKNESVVDPALSLVVCLGISYIDAFELHRAPNTPNVRTRLIILHCIESLINELLEIQSYNERPQQRTRVAMR
uniref:Uncharacterized protein n=1 Tax=Trichogramma kaykai TaxID=54128 RepID=A0ABD2X0R0_9HYME